MRTQFNTKRLYTVEGQIIVAEQNPGTLEVHFNDLSRGISGKFQVGVELPNPRTLRAAVMEHYDYCDYITTSLGDAPKFDPKEELDGGLVGTEY